MGELRIAANGGLGLGTRIFSPQAIFNQHAWTGPAGTVLLDWSCDLSASVQESPFVLQQNEGLVVRIGSTPMGAGGSLRAAIEISWAEMALGAA